MCIKKFFNRSNTPIQHLSLTRHIFLCRMWLIKIILIFTLSRPQKTSFFLNWYHERRKITSRFFFFPAITFFRFMEKEVVEKFSQTVMAKAWKSRRKSWRREKMKILSYAKKIFLTRKYSPICNKNLILDIKLYFILFRDFFLGENWDFLENCTQQWEPFCTLKISTHHFSHPLREKLFPRLCCIF